MLIELMLKLDKSKRLHPGRRTTATQTLKTRATRRRMLYKWREKSRKKLNVHLDLKQESAHVYTHMQRDSVLEFGNLIVIDLDLDI